jgi:hypothetical protein
MPDSSTLVLNLRARLRGAFGQGWKCLPMTNALAYSAAVMIIFDSSESFTVVS